MTVYTPNSDDRRPREGASDENRTMGAVDHTNPYTDEAFGDTVAYSRGRVAVVDGGEADAEPEDDEREADETIGDVDHTPREDAPSTNEVYERGVEADAGDEAEAEDDETDADDEESVADAPEVTE